VNEEISTFSFFSSFLLLPSFPSFSSFLSPSRSFSFFSFVSFFSSSSLSRCRPADQLLAGEEGLGLVVSKGGDAHQSVLGDHRDESLEELEVGKVFPQLVLRDRGAGQIRPERRAKGNKTDGLSASAAEDATTS
jgi:hypothetical protein